ncbi:hypothetical protein [Mycolicibacterium gilvum]|uniref:hypothetical protein n=1 Tax=Mycolicibacterium gilvum TaxID=1804 RepID=UPI004045CB4E
MPLNFTLHYDDRVNSVTDFTGDVQAVNTIGPIYFEPTILPGYRIPVQDYSPRPTGVGIQQFSGFLDSDGRLKKERGGEVGLRLWANDPAWKLPQFQYRVTADLTDPLGNKVDWQPFYFDAPKADVVRYLTQEMPRPGQKFGRGRHGFTIDSIEVDDDGFFVATREDNVDLDPVPIAVSPIASAAYAMTFGR